MSEDDAKIRVLFVDDDQAALDQLREQLTALKLGWDMVFVGGGQAALKRLETNPFDAIVSDLNNRHMPGEELMAEVHARFPDVVRIIVSSEVGRSHLHRLADSDHFYLTKPVRPGALVGAIEEAHELHRALKHGKEALALEEVQDILVQFFVNQIRHQKLRLDEIPPRIRPLLPEHALDAAAAHYDESTAYGDHGEPDRAAARHGDWLDLTEPE